MSRSVRFKAMYSWRLGGGSTTSGWSKTPAASRWSSPIRRFQERRPRRSSRRHICGAGLPGLRGGAALEGRFQDHPLDVFRYHVRRAPAIHSAYRRFTVPLEDRAGQFAIGAQPLANRGFPVVVARDQFRAVVVASAFHPRGLGEQVVDAPALRALPARRQPRHQRFLLNVEVDNHRRGQSPFAQQAAEILRLRNGARIAIEQKAVGTVRLRDAAGHDCVGNLVGDQPARGHDRARRPAEFRAGLAFGPEHFPRGDGGNVKTVRKKYGLRTLTASGRSEKQKNQEKAPIWLACAG